MAENDADEIELSAYADAAVEKLEGEMLQKYKISLRDVLLNPAEYSEKPNIQDTIKSMKKEVDDYFNEIKSEYATEEKNLNAELKRIDDLYKKIDAMIETKAKALNVPYISPLAINRDTNTEEIVVLYDYETGVDELLERLLPASVYVADISTAYKDYMIGFWFFSGPKSRAISINPPTSPLLEMEASRAEIDSILDQVTVLS